MRTGISQIDIVASAEDIFDLTHDYSRRLDWDPFLREATLLDGRESAGLGVVSRCVARWRIGGMAMETAYITFRRPTVAAVEMTRGPFLFRSFAASLRHEVLSPQVTRVTYRYRFELRPEVSFVLDPIVNRVFERETAGRLRALKRYLERIGTAR